MKKKNLNKLNLKKRAVSRLDHISAGVAAANPIASSNPQPVGTNVWSNCQICDSLRVTQCKGADCPNFTNVCNDKEAQPINGAL
ncbi:hypothetical protein EZY14_014840 [Kordia sp. TARA_039_SRF]|nr:hypothetical protein EZY14_014840 [Kordia sp. TARA_039_SRF]